MKLVYAGVGRVGLASFHRRKEVAPLKRFRSAPIIMPVPRFHRRKEVAPLKQEVELPKRIRGLLVSTAERRWPH